MGGGIVYILSFPRRSLPILPSPPFTIHHFIEIIPKQLLYPGWACHRNQFLMGSYILLMLSSCMPFFSLFFSSLYAPSSLWNWHDPNQNNRCRSCLAIPWSIKIGIHSLESHSNWFALFPLSPIYYFFPPLDCRILMDYSDSPGAQLYSLWWVLRVFG